MLFDLSDSLTLLTSSEMDLCLDKGFLGVIVAVALFEGEFAAFILVSVIVLDLALRFVPENMWFKEDVRATVTGGERGEVRC